MIKLNNLKYLIFTIIAACITWLSLQSFKFEAGLIVLDVGQGDAILISGNNGLKILIDGGPDLSLIPKLDRYLGGKRRLDIAILTHEHADHKIGWLAAIERYKPRLIIFSQPEADQLLPEINHLKLPDSRIIGLEQIVSFDLGANCHLQLWPAPHPIKAGNSHSISAKASCPSGSWLGTGDLETDGESGLLDKGYNVDVDIFKAAHHGADSANSPIFLEKISPKTIIIPVGANNRFGHPGLKLLKFASEKNIKILRTDQDGDVTWNFKEPPP
jgi:competence protein ComEC